jgi:hypothetical protein
MSVLPIWLLCWIYQNRRFYRGWVGKSDKDSLARPRVVTGLTGARHRSDRWRPTSTRGPNSENILTFTPLFSPPLFTSIHLIQTMEAPLFSSLSPLSTPMEIWSFNQRKDSRLEAKGYPKAPLHFPLQVLLIQLKFLSPKVFKSSFCPISLHGAKIWISIGRASSEIT